MSLPSVPTTAENPVRLPMNAAIWESIVRQFEFTPQQIKVAELLLQGKKNKQIATELDLSEATVCSHFKSIFKRTDTDTRTTLILRIFRVAMEISESDHSS